MRLWVHFWLTLPLPPLIGWLGMSRLKDHHSMLSHNVKGLLAACAFNMVLFAVFFGLAIWSSRSTRDDLLLRVRRPFASIFLGLGYSVAIRFSLGIVAAILIGVVLATGAATIEQVQGFTTANRPDVETVVSISSLKDNPLYYWLMISVVSFVVAGLREELWRCAALASLTKLWPRFFGESSGGRIGAILITSILFGLAHAPMGPLAIVATTLIGIALGAIMVAHRSIWPAVIAHGAFDATTFALLPHLAELLKKVH